MSGIAPLKKYAIGQEAHKDGHPHIHGYFKFKKPHHSVNKEWAYIDGHHNNDGGNPRDLRRVLDYCVKEDEDPLTNMTDEELYPQDKPNNWVDAKNKPTYDECITHLATTEVKEFMKFGTSIRKNCRFYFPEPEELIPEAPIEKLLDWQQEVWDLLQTEPEKRRIIWIWSTASLTGKSYMCDYVTNRMPCLPGSLTLKDTLYSLTRMKMPKVIWFDTARASPHEFEFLSQAEKLSDQTKLTSTKYKCKTVLVKCHVVISCNKPPPTEKLLERIVEIYAVGPKQKEPHDEDLDDLMRMNSYDE